MVKAKSIVGVVSARPSKRLAGAALAGAALAWPVAAQAALSTYSWTTPGTSSTWSDASAWTFVSGSGNTPNVPGTVGTTNNTDTARLLGLASPATAVTTINLDANYNVQNLFYATTTSDRSSNSSASAYTISSSNGSTLLMSSGGLIQDSNLTTTLAQNVLTVSAPIVIQNADGAAQGTLTIANRNSKGSMVFSGGISGSAAAGGTSTLALFSNTGSNLFPLGNNLDITSPITDGTAGGNLAVTFSTEFGGNYGKLYLTGANTYSGGTTLNASVSGNDELDFNSDAAFGTGPITFTSTPASNNTILRNGNSQTHTIANNIVVNSAAVLNGNTTNVATNWTGVISGTGTLAVQYGTQTFTAANTFTGVETLSNNATLATPLLANGGTASGIGQASNAAANLVINGAALRYTGPTATTDRLFTNNATGGAILDASGTGTIGFTNPGGIAFGTAAGNRTITLTGTNTGLNTFAPLLANPTTSGTTTGLTKTGVGTWAIADGNGGNTYSGTTAVNAGTLLANNSVSSFGSGAVNVISILGGTGVTGTGVVSINNGGTLTAGTGATAADQLGKLTTAASETWASGGKYAAKINAALAPATSVAAAVATAGVTNDEVVMNGLTVAASGFGINILSLGNNVLNTPVGTYYWQIAMVNGSADPFANPNALFTLNTAGISTNTTGTFDLLDNPTASSDGLLLRYNATSVGVPEPTGLAAVAAAAVPLLAKRRRRSANSPTA